MKLRTTHNTKVLFFNAQNHACVYTSDPTLEWDIPTSYYWHACGTPDKQLNFLD